MAEKKPNCEQPNPNESGNTTPKLNPNDPAIRRPERNMPAEKSAKGSQDIRGFTQPKNKKGKTLGAFNPTSKSYEELYLEAMTSKKDPYTVNEIVERKEKNLNEIGQTYEADGKKYVDIKDTQNRENKNISDVEVPQTKKFKYQEFEENVVHRTKEENTISIDLNRPQKYKEETFNTTQAQKGREDVIIPTNKRSTKFNSSEDVTKNHFEKTASEVENFDVTSSPKITNEEEFNTTAPTSSPKKDDDVNTPPYQVNYKVFNAENITVNTPSASSKTEKDYDTTAPTTSPKKEVGPEVEVENKSPKSEFNVETNLSSKEKSEEELGVKDPGIEKSEEELGVKDPGIEKSEEDITAKTKYWSVKDELPTEPKDPGIEKNELDVETNLDSTEKEREDLGIKEPGLKKTEQIVTEEANPNAETEKNKAEFFDDAEEINTGSIEYEGKSGYRINIFKETNRESINKVDQSGETVSWDKYGGVESPEFEDGNEPISNIHNDGTAVNKHMDYSQSNTQSRYGKGVRYEKDDGDREKFPGQSSSYYREITEKTNIGEPLFSTNKTNGEIINRNTNYSQDYEFTVKADGLKEEIVNWNDYKTEGTNTPNEIDNFEDPIVYKNDFVNSNFNYSTREHSYSVKTDGLKNENVDWNNYKTESIDQEETDDPIISTNKDSHQIIINRNTNYSSIETNYTTKLDSITGSPVVWSNYDIVGDENPNNVGDDYTAVNTLNQTEGIVSINRNIDFEDYEAREILDTLGIGEVSISEEEKAKSTLKLSRDDLTKYESKYFQITEDKTYIPALDTKLSSNYNYYDSDFDMIVRTDDENMNKRSSKDEITTEASGLINVSTLLQSKSESYTKYSGSEYTAKTINDNRSIDPLISTNYSYTNDNYDKITNRTKDVMSEDDDGFITTTSGKIDSSPNLKRESGTTLYETNLLSQETTPILDPDVKTNYEYSLETNYSKTDGTTGNNAIWGNYSIGGFNPYTLDEESEAMTTLQDDSYREKSEINDDSFDINNISIYNSNLYNTQEIGDSGNPVYGIVVNRNSVYTNKLNDLIKEGNYTWKNTVYSVYGDSDNFSLSEYRDNALASFFGLGLPDYGRNDYKLQDLNFNEGTWVKNYLLGGSKEFSLYPDSRDIYVDTKDMWVDPDMWTQIATTLDPDIGSLISSLQTTGNTIGDALSILNNAANILSGDGDMRDLGNISNEGSQLIRQMVTNDLSKMVGTYFRSMDIYTPKQNAVGQGLHEMMNRTKDYVESIIGPLQQPQAAINKYKPSSSQIAIDSITHGVTVKEKGIWPNTGWYYQIDVGNNERYDLIDNIATSPSHLPYEANGLSLPEPSWPPKIPGRGDDDDGTGLKSKFERYRRSSLAQVFANVAGGSQSNYLKDQIFKTSNINISNTINNISIFDKELEKTELYVHSPYNIENEYKSNILGNYLYQFKVTGDGDDKEFDIWYNINEDTEDTEYRRYKYFTSKPETLNILSDERNNFFNISKGNDGTSIELANYLFDNYTYQNFDKKYDPLPFSDDYNKSNKDFTGPIDLFKIGDESDNFSSIGTRSELYRKIDINDENPEAPDIRIYSNNFVNSIPNLDYYRKNIFTGEEINEEDSFDPHLIFYNYKANDENKSDENRRESPGSYIGARGNLRKIKRDSNELEDVLFLGNPTDWDDFEISGATFFGNIRSNESDTIKRRDYFAVKSPNQNFYDNLFSNNFKSNKIGINYQGDEDISSIDPHTLVVNKVSNIGGDYKDKDNDDVANGGTTFGGKDAFYKFAAGEYLKSTFAQSVSGTETNEEEEKKNILHYGLSDFIEEDDFDVKKTNWEYGDKINFYNELRSREDLNFHKKSYLKSGGNKDPHFIDYLIRDENPETTRQNDRTSGGDENNSGGTPKAIDLLNGKGEMLAFVEKNSNNYKTLFSHMYENNEDTSIFKDLNTQINSEEESRKSFIITSPFTSDILIRERNQNWVETKTNSQMIQPRIKTLQYDDGTIDQRYTEGDGEEKKITNIFNLIDPLHAPEVDGESPDREVVGWHLTDPSNRTDYDTLTNVELGKASINQNKRYGNSVDLHVDYFENNSFNELFDEDEELGLVGKDQELPEREWDDDALPEGRKRPFALKKPLRINTFGWVDEGNDGKLEQLEMDNILNREDSPRLDRIDLYSNGREGIQRADTANPDHQRRNMMLNMSNKGQYFIYIRDDGTHASVDENDLDYGSGYIAALDRPDQSIAEPRFSIPFQFAAEVSGEQRAADWATETAIGRTAEWYLWSRTNTRTIQLKTNYVITAPSSPGDDRFINTNSGDSSDESLNFLSIWNQEKVINTLNKLRSLILPLGTEEKGDFMPPTVVIVLNNYLLTAYQQGSSMRTKKLSRWVAQDVNIDPQYDFGLSSTRDPLAYEINITFKEVFPWTTIQTWETTRSTLLFDGE